MISEDVDLHGRLVVLSSYDGDEAARTFRCESGFGCKPQSLQAGQRREHGRAIFGAFASDGEQARVLRADIERLLPAPIEPPPPEQPRPTRADLARDVETARQNVHRAHHHGDGPMDGCGKGTCQRLAYVVKQLRREGS